MNREFLINIALLIGINLLIKPFYLFGIDAKIQFLVGQEAYGVFFTLFNFSYLFQIVNDPGIQNYNSHKVASDDKFIHQNLGKLISTKLILGLAFLSVVMIGGLIMDYPKHYFYILALVTINHFLATFFIFLRSNLAALGRYRTDSYISGLDKLLMVVILGYMLYISEMGPDFKIEYLIYVQMLSYLIACLVASGFLKSSIQKIQLSWNLPYFKNLIRDTLPFALVLLLMTMYSRMDAVMLERILKDNGFQSGVYASCYRFMEALNMIAYLFAALLLPMYARLLKNKASLISLSDTALRVMLVISFSAAMTIIAFNKEILTFLYPYADEQYSTTLSYLVVSFVAFSIANIYGSMQVANGTLKSLNIIFLLGVVLNFALNFWLIPIYFAVGAAIATLVTQVFVMFGQIVLGHQRFGIPINTVLLFRTILWIGVCIVSIYVIKSSFFDNYLFEMCLTILICGLTSLLLGVVKKDVLFSLLKKSN